MPNLRGKCAHGVFDELRVVLHTVNIVGCMRWRAVADHSYKMPPVPVDSTTRRVRTVTERYCGGDIVLVFRGNAVHPEGCKGHSEHHGEHDVSMRNNPLRVAMPTTRWYAKGSERSEECVLNECAAIDVVGMAVHEYVLAELVHKQFLTRSDVFLATSTAICSQRLNSEHRRRYGSAQQLCRGGHGCIPMQAEQIVGIVVCLICPDLRTQQQFQLFLSLLGGLRTVIQTSEYRIEGCKVLAEDIASWRRKHALYVLCDAVHGISSASIFGS